MNRTGYAHIAFSVDGKEKKTGRLFYIGLSVPCSTIAQITVCFLFLTHVKKYGLKAARRAHQFSKR